MATTTSYLSATSSLFFSRRTENDCAIVLLNAADAPAAFKVRPPELGGATLTDLLNPGDRWEVRGDHVEIDDRAAQLGPDPGAGSSHVNRSS